jgi:thymidylate synthase
MADVQYNRLVQEIIDKGVWDKDQNVRPVWKDGTPAYTKSLISAKLAFDNSEIPILTTKELKWQTAIKEILWIWQMKSNRVQDLRDLGVNIWNEWEREDGTIGHAYGYALNKRCRRLNGEMVDQVDMLLHELKHNPASRRHIVTLWDPNELDDMVLTPCVYESQWLVKEGKLHTIVGIRSNDIGIGGPFNYFQYAVLQRMIAQVTGYNIGTLTFEIRDAHIYDRHIQPLTEQLTWPQYQAPTLWMNPTVKNFYDFTIDDFQLIDYQHGPFIRMEIAI